eukprot:g1093.t1
MAEYIFSCSELMNMDDSVIASVFAQILGEYLRSIPGSLISRQTTEIIARKASDAIKRAEEDGEDTDSASLAEAFYSEVNKGQTQADLHALRFLLKFFWDHILATAMFGSVTPLDVAENVYGWVFSASFRLHDEEDLSTGDSNATYRVRAHEEIADSLALALAVLIENCPALGPCPSVYGTSNGSIASTLPIIESATFSEPRLVESSTSYNGVEIENLSNPGVLGAARAEEAAAFSASGRNNQIHDDFFEELRCLDSEDFEAQEDSTMLTDDDERHDEPHANDETNSSNLIDVLAESNPENKQSISNAKSFKLDDASSRPASPSINPELRAIHSMIEQNALLFRESVRGVSVLAKDLADACSDASKQANRMRLAFKNSTELVYTTRKRIISESQKLARMLDRAGTDSTMQLKHMNSMLQQTLLQLLDEKADIEKTLEEACNPKFLGLTRQNATASKFLESMERAQIFVNRCAIEIANNEDKYKGQRRMNNAGILSNVRMAELKRLRAEVVRLRYAMHIKSSEKIENKNIKSREHHGDKLYANYQRESMDAQVISDLKRQVVALKDMPRGAPPIRATDILQSKSNLYIDLKLKLQKAMKAEYAHVSLCICSQEAKTEPR